jgi:hypothetical protein
MPIQWSPDNPSPKPSAEDQAAAGHRSAGGRSRLALVMPSVAMAILTVALVGGSQALGPAGPAQAQADAGRGGADHQVRRTALDARGEEFVRIALAFTQHAPAEVDSYFGPASLRPIAATANGSRGASSVCSALSPIAALPALPASSDALADLSRRTHRLLQRLESDLRSSGSDDRAGRRLRDLMANARALAATIDHRAFETTMSFDEEAAVVYGMSFDASTSTSTSTSVADPAAADAHQRGITAGAEAEQGGSTAASHAENARGAADADQSRSDAALVALDRAVPGDGALVARFAAYRQRFAIPSERRRAVFAAALAECRARTLSHWTLPAGEHLDVKWSISAPGAWHRYAGGGRSTLTINPAAVEFIDSAIDLACHEGYPGHHAQFLLADSVDPTGSIGPADGIGPASGAEPAVSIGRRDGALDVEQTIALLRSPVSMLREGAANYAVELAFPPAQRRRFERDVLFPLAGLDPADADAWFDARQQVRTLEPAIAPILRAYRDGRVSPEDAADRLARRALVSNPQALLRFVDDLGPYALGYTVARDRVAAFVTAKAAAHATENAAAESDIWTALREILRRPDLSALEVHPRPMMSSPSQANAIGTAGGLQ